MRPRKFVSTGVVLALLAARLGAGEAVSHPQLGLRLSVPDGFVPEPDRVRGRVVCAFHRSPAGGQQVGTSILVSRLGGLLGREKLDRTPSSAAEGYGSVQRSDLIQSLRQRGWAVTERPAQPLRLPPEVAARHPKVPPSLVAFLGGLSACEDATQTAWFLCEADYAGTAGSAFRWDEWERMSRDAADGDPRLLAEVRAFWDAHLPFLLSVRDGYAYHAVRTAADGFGRVVAGREPEFEEASVVAESFGEFLSSLLGAAPDAEPGAAADRGRT